MLRLAQPNEIEAVLANVTLIARATTPYPFPPGTCETAPWEDVGRPLTFPWEQ